MIRLGRPLTRRVGGFQGGRRLRERPETVSWKRNGAAIIFIPGCSCFAPTAGLPGLDVPVARKPEKGGKYTRNEDRAASQKCGAKARWRPAGVPVSIGSCVFGAVSFPGLLLAGGGWGGSGGASGSAAACGTSDLLLMRPLEQENSSLCWRSGRRCGRPLCAGGAEQPRPLATCPPPRPPLLL